ncbi:MAG: hypothetical protein KKG99_11890 [Bacteroidetes bacterium]|nr:hypothetical protein [Bacteroidota bacterium]
MNAIKLISPLLMVFIFFLGQSVYAQENNNQIEVGYRMTGEIDVQGFSLSGQSTIKIEGHAGLYERMGNDLMFYGWILNGKTREVVWDILKEENDKFFGYRNSGRFKFNNEITLPAGDYEVYYAAGIDQGNYNNNNNFNFGDLLDWIFDGNSRERDRDSRRYSDFSMQVSGPENSFIKNDWRKSVDAFAQNAIVSIVRAGDDEFMSENFKVENEIELNIRGIGEQYDGEQFDFAWIVNSSTYEKVWPTEDTRFLKAGGGRKNRLVSEKITLQKGDYTLYYISDGSHSFQRWNVLPPYDPQFWGISIWTDEKNQNKVKLNDKSDQFVLKLTKARDDDYLSQAFKLKKDMKIRVYSIGERSGSSEMVDYGWIINSDTHKKVWEFDGRNSEYAGGGDKNRLVNEEIELKAGNYIAYYVTDGSHSYRNWNVAPPLIPDLYGLSILAGDNRDFFELQDTHVITNENVLAEIVRVRNNEYEKRSFTLNKESKVRIYAIGEGTGWEMNDSGWIKSKETGRVVWEMTPRNTDPAGGAEKNKLFDGTITLPEGEYTVYYETDGSHSYRNWNASAPHDQEHYGISVYLIK